VEGRRMKMGRVYSRHRIYDKYMKNFGKPEGKTNFADECVKEEIIVN
jgi:hypothetical protein